MSSSRMGKGLFADHSKFLYLYNFFLSERLILNFERSIKSSSIMIHLGLFSLELQVLQDLCSQVHPTQPMLAPVCHPMLTSPF